MLTLNACSFRVCASVFCLSRRNLHTNYAWDRTLRKIESRYVTYITFVFLLNVAYPITKCQVSNIRRATFQCRIDEEIAGR